MIKIFRHLRQSLTYLSIFYFVFIRVFFLYLLKWWGHIELWTLHCEIPPIIPQTNSQQILFSVILIGYVISLCSMLIQTSKSVRYYFPSIHKYIGYIMYLSLLMDIILIPIVSSNPFILIITTWIGICSYKSFINIYMDYHKHKWWSEILYYSLYGIVMYQITLSWFYTFSITSVHFHDYISVISIVLPLISMKLKNSSVILLFQVLTIYSVVYNLLVHLGVFQQK